MSKSKRPLAVKPIDRVDWTCVRVQRVEHQPSTQIFAQGDPAASVMYVETGGVRLSVHRADAPMVQTIMFITERLMAGIAAPISATPTMADTSGHGSAVAVY